MTTFESKWLHECGCETEGPFTACEHSNTSGVFYAAEWPSYDDVIEGSMESLRQAQAHLNTTGCENCDDNDGDPKWRCLEHRTVGPLSCGSPIEWMDVRRSIESTTIPDPNDTIEGRHRRAARRWAAVRARRPR